MAFAKYLIHLVILVKVSSVIGTLQCVKPLGSLTLGGKIEQSRLLWRQHNFQRVESNLRFRAPFEWILLDESLGQTVHDSVVFVRLIPVEEDLIPT